MTVPETSSQSPVPVSPADGPSLSAAAPSITVAEPAALPDPAAAAPLFERESFVAGDAAGEASPEQRLAAQPSPVAAEPLAVEWYDDQGRDTRGQERRSEAFRRARERLDGLNLATATDIEAQAAYIEVVRTHPLFGYVDPDGSKTFGPEASFGKDNARRMKSVLDGSDPDALYSQEYREWKGLTPEAQADLAANRRSVGSTLGAAMTRTPQAGGISAPGGTALPAVAPLPPVAAEERESVRKEHEDGLLKRQRGAWFAAVSADLSDIGRDWVKASLDQGAPDPRALWLVPDSDRGFALAAYRIAKGETDVNALMAGAMDAASSAKGMTAGAGGMLRYLYQVTGGRAPSGGPRRASLDAEETMRAQLEESAAPVFKKYGFGGEAVKGLVGSLPLMLSYTNPYTGTLATLGMAEDARRSMLVEGVDPETAAAVGLAVGVVNSRIEKLQWEQMTGAGMSELQLRTHGLAAMVKALAKRDLGRTAQHVGKMSRHGAKVWGTELAEEVLQNLDEEAGTQFAKRDLDVAAFAETFFETAAAASPTTFAFGMVAGSGAGASVGAGVRRLRSRDAVNVGDIAEIARRRLAALHAVNQADGADAEPGEKSARTDALVRDLRTAWRAAPDKRAAVRAMEDAGLDRGQVALLDELFQAEATVAGESAAFRSMYLAEDLDADISPESILSVSPAFVAAEALSDTETRATLRLADGQETTVLFRKGDLSRSADPARFDAQVRAAIGAELWDGMNEGERDTVRARAEARADFRVTVDDAGIDADGIVTIAAPDGQGGGARMGDVYHEAFHASTLLAHKAGVISDAQVQTLRGLFGDPQAAGELFNEEAAADAYATWLAGKGSDASGVFAAVRDFFRTLYEAVFRRPATSAGGAWTVDDVFNAVSEGSLELIPSAAIPAKEPASASAPDSAPDPAPAPAPAATDEPAQPAEAPAPAAPSALLRKEYTRPDGSVGVLVYRKVQPVTAERAAPAPVEDPAPVDPALDNQAADEMLAADDPFGDPVDMAPPSTAASPSVTADGSNPYAIFGGAPAEAGPRGFSEGAFIRSGVTPVIEALYQIGGVMSPGQAAKEDKAKGREPQGEYDGAPKNLGPSWNKFVYGGTQRPDTAAQELADAGVIADAYPDTLWQAIEADVERYKATQKADADTEAEAKQAAKFAADSADPTKAAKERNPVWLPVSRLKPGDIVHVRTKKGGAVVNERLAVTGIDKDSGDVVLEDGKTYGRQEVPKTGVIYVAKVTTAAGRKVDTEKRTSRFSLKPSGDLFSFDSLTPAELKRDTGRITAAQEREARRQEMLRRAGAPLTGTAGDMTGTLPGMEGTSDVPLFTEQDGFRFSVKVTPEQDAAYLAAVAAGDTQKTQRLFVDAARSAGYKVGAFHQTSEEAKAAIFAEGFRLDKGRARLSDELVPDGFFFKPFNDDIAVGAYGSKSVQIPVVLQMSNTLEVSDRFALEMILEQLPEYSAMRYDMKTINREEAKIHDELEKKLGATLGQERQDEKYGAVLDEMGDQIDQWGEKTNKQAALMRALVTSWMRKEGHDSLLIQSDAGSFNRKVTTYVVLNPGQIKSSDPVTRDDSGAVIPLSQRFNPQVNDLRFSIRLNGNPEDIAAAVIAAKMLRGQGVTEATVGKMLAGMGSKTPAADVMSRARAVSEGYKSQVRHAAESDRELLETLRAASMEKRFFDRIDDVAGVAFEEGSEEAKAAVRMEDAKRKAVAREIENAEGFAAATLELEYGVDFAEALLASPVKADAGGQKAEDATGQDAAADAADMPDLSPDGQPAAAPADPVPVSPAALAALERIRTAAQLRAEADKAARAEAAKRRQAAADLYGVDTAADAAAAGGSGAADAAAQQAALAGTRREAFAIEDPAHFRAMLEEMVIDRLSKRAGFNAERPFASPAALREFALTAKHVLTGLSAKLEASGTREGTRLFLEKLTDYQRLASLEGAIEAGFARIHGQMIRESRERLVARLETDIRLAAGARGQWQRGGDEARRTVEARVEEWARLVIGYLRMSDAEMEAEADRLDGILEGRKAAASAAAGYNLAFDRDFQGAIDRKAALTNYGGLILRMPGEITDAAAEIMEQIDGGRQRLEDKRDARDERTQRMANQFAAAVENPSGAEMPDPGRWGMLADSLLGIFSLRLRDLMRYSRGDVRARAEAVAEDVGYLISRASEVRAVYAIRQREAMRDGLKAVYGSERAALARLDSKLPDGVWQDLTNQGVRMTVGQALQLYASILQSDYRDNSATHKRDGARLATLKAQFTEQDLALLAWLRNWYRDNRGALDEAYLPVTGLSIQSPGDTYLPVVPLRPRSGLAAKVKAWSPLPASLTPRVRHRLDFDERADILTLWDSRLGDSASAIAYAETGIELAAVFGRDHLQERIVRHHGEDSLRRMLSHLTDTLRGGKSADIAEGGTAAADTFRAWVSRFTLSGNLGSALKQVAAFPAFALHSDVGLADVMRHMVNIDRAAVRDLTASDGFKARYGSGISEEIANALRGERHGWLARVYNYGFEVVQRGDMLTAMWIGQGVYRARLAALTDGGTDPALAKRRALAETWAIIESTQQSARVENQNAIQRNGGGLGRLLYQFVSSPAQQLAYEVQAIREAVALKGAEGSKAKLLRVLFINHAVVPAMMLLATAAWRSLLGYPEDEKEDAYWETVAANMLAGPSSGLFLAGAAGEGGLQALLTGKRDWRSQGLPVENIYQIFETVGITAHDLLIEWDAEKVKADLLRLIKSTSAPGRAITQAVQNRTD